MPDTINRDNEGTIAMPRTPEQGHTKKCYARALICAVENLRDDETLSDIGFALAIQENIRYTALDYYDGLLDCICPPHPSARFDDPTQY